MTRPNITPGPWHIGKRAGADHGATYGEKGEEIALPLGFFMEDREAKANARAIAAVPALLEALEAALKWSDEVPSPYRDWPFIQQARSALIAAGYQF